MTRFIESQKPSHPSVISRVPSAKSWSPNTKEQKTGNIYRVDSAASLKSIAHDHQLVFDFFELFSRFECVLKRSGYVTSGSHDSASADWNCFSNQICGKLSALTDPGFISAKDFLLHNPPKLQKYNRETKRLTWEKNEKQNHESDSSRLLRLVRDVRNNLFHGGKYPADQGGPVDEAARNSQLLKACLTILRACKPLDDEVRKMFAKTT